MSRLTEQKLPKIFLMQAAQQEKDSGKAVEAFLPQGLNNLLYDIPHLAARIGSQVNVREARRTLDVGQGKRFYQCGFVAGNLPVPAA